MSRSGSITTTVSVDVADVLDEISDGDLISEIEARNLKVGIGCKTDILTELHSLLVCHKVASAIALIEREIFPQNYGTAASAYHRWLGERNNLPVQPRPA